MNKVKWVAATLCLAGSVYFLVFNGWISLALLGLGTALVVSVKPEVYLDDED